MSIATDAEYKLCKSQSNRCIESQILLTQNSINTPLRADDKFSPLAHHLIGISTQSKVPSHNSHITLTWFQWPILVTILGVFGQRFFECEGATRWGFSSAVTIIAVPEVYIRLVTVFNLAGFQALVKTNEIIWLWVRVGEVNSNRFTCFADTGFNCASKLNHGS